MTSTTHAETLLESLVNHVALPPHLPGQQDGHLNEVEPRMLAFVLNSVGKLNSGNDLDNLRRSLQTCKVVNAGGGLYRPSLLTALRELHVGGFLVLHVSAQNAGLIIRRDHKESNRTVLFEAFEASPLSEEVLASESALLWDFPGCAVALPITEFDKPSFQSELATFLEKASTESIKQFAARTNKAGSSAFESRDSVDPSLITQFLVTLLEVNGTRVYPALLQKRVRDDVCWDGAENPWRRSSFWLVLRVAVQRHLCAVFGGDGGRVRFKFIMCLVLAHLLDESLHHLGPELLVHVKAKLCRRLVKLEVEKERAFGKLREVSEHMFEALQPTFLSSITMTTERLHHNWAKYRKAIERPVLPLPRRADQRHLYLTLPNSANYIHEVLSVPLHSQSGLHYAAAYRLPQGYDVSTAVTKSSTAFASRYFLLSNMESEVQLDVYAMQQLDDFGESRCTNIAKKIQKYLTTVASAYDFNPEQKSVMLLTVMEFWMLLDKTAVKLFPLLADYNPGFSPDILDVLQLSRFSEMCRLQNIRAYLCERNRACQGSHRTIFNDPGKGCFGERFYEESKDSSRLAQLHQHIEADAEQARARKEQEWREKSLEYNQLLREIGEASCLYTTDDFGGKVHEERRCKKCFLERQKNRFRMQAYEHPLPTDPIQAKTVVFELGCPKALLAYRETTWRIIGSLALEKPVEGHDPVVVLRDYPELKAYSHSITPGYSLASVTKSFLKTHYASPKFPVDLDDICLPNGLRFRYFDTSLKVWPGQQSHKATFAHHCQITLPANSPFSSIQLSSESTVDGLDLSSYQIVASQTKCPAGLNVHEFMAFQTLLSGRARRWTQILVELGSTNINFGTESTTILMGLLALQAGPSYGDNPLGTVHKIFEDTTFCQRLLDQLGRRLDTISSNYRETNCMETLITLILRLSSLAVSVSPESIELLERARVATFKWLTFLRSEIYVATDVNTSRRCSRYALWSALLCRRTFAVFTDRNETLGPTALQCFIGCSITLQDNLADDPTTLPYVLRNAIIRDAKMVYQMRVILRQSLEASPDSLTLAITAAWPDPEGGPCKTFSKIEFLDEPNQWWVKVNTNPTPLTMQQTVHFHLLEGHLLVMGKAVGKLPAEHRTSPVLRQLFDNQSLLTYPSALPGMTYVLAIIIEGHQIHIGFRKGNLIVRACLRHTTLELIPSDKFENLPSFDLPSSLITNCVHWLELHTGLVEIRQQPNIWRSRKSNWVLNFNTRLAMRRTVTLVDPQSPLFSRVARIFSKFEYHNHLTVFQPSSRPLSVELRRLELSFIVNGRNLLECPRLQAEITTDQDAGTWYGLNSKIVMKEVVRHRDPYTQRPFDSQPGDQRSIIVPFGGLAYKLLGPHVAVDVVNGGEYAKFTINNVLRRLDCPAEPRLLYSKALFHAYTSFVLPDPLTGRTGTEEALHCLRSGYCQPWNPVAKGPQEILQHLAKLTPHREYYPRSLRVMQKTRWDPQLTTSIQHDDFRAIVDSIRAKSESLSVFDTGSAKFSLEAGGESHLTLRNQLRRRAYQRPDAATAEQQASTDPKYVSRDRWLGGPRRANVIECTSLIRDWPSKIHTPLDLAGILQNWTNIGGYVCSFDKILLTDFLDVQFDTLWGPLVNVCRESTSESAYRLMFLFGMICFRQDINMAVARTLIAFALLADLKVLRLPEWPNYSHFRYNQEPRVDYLVQLMKPHLAPYGDDERSTFGFALNPKQRRKLQVAELAHEKQQQKDATIFGEFLLKQWPRSEPTMEGFSTSILIDVAKAMETIRPEWQRLFQNWELSQHVTQVQSVLDHHRAEAEIISSTVEAREQEVIPTRIRGGEFPTLAETLLRKSLIRAEMTSAVLDLGAMPSEHLHLPVPNGLSQKAGGLPRNSFARNGKVSQLAGEVTALSTMIQSFIGSNSTVRQQYGKDLKQSMDALQNSKNTPVSNELAIDSASLPVAVSRAQSEVQCKFDQLRKSFESKDSRVQWLQHGGLWPVITPVTLLENLRSTSRCIFGDCIKESLISYALSITTLQRLIRLKDAQQKSHHQRIIEEQQNIGHRNWQPQERTDWLLLEIDANMLIRPTQVDVALATVSPISASNSVLQMNMGQGKTSCIIPMAAAILADGWNLHRVVVPKPLLLQTAQLLQARLGGLLGREIRHIPFSRKTPTSSETVKAFYTLHKEIQKAHGVMLALPEHLLSFMLSGLQRLSDGRVDEAKAMIQVQDWLTRKARDVLDECDSILAIRTQLIYPSGSQKTVDGHPHRWEIIEALLSRVNGHLWSLHERFPQSIEVVSRSQGGFPAIYFLRKDVEDHLIARLVDDICCGQLSIIPSDCSNVDRLAIKQFISHAKVAPEVAQSIRQIYPDKPVARQAIHLLRGLFVHRILLMTLKKRWNVQYGLHPGRDPIAVPYNAKGTPSDQAEWGHPDVAILFTCLAFYYDGLNVSQLSQTLEHVLKSDDPSEIYDRFSHESSLPDSLREWNAINVDDEAQLKEIWKHVRYTVVVIDYFLNSFVFPRHAKQFQMKLQASGWDLPLTSFVNPSNQVDKPRRPTKPLTTGFSGTNDWKRMLPLTIHQRDLPRLAHTNAEVLIYLLQPRNRRYFLAADSRGRHISEHELLVRINSLKIRVLIDAGAQILEMTNHALAKAWLEIAYEAPAAVYFNEKNRPFVLYRQGHVIPLLASPFAEDLGECLVYLDEAHTRGTDLKFPADACGVLTLGLGQPKDHTVQAAMRLRQLGTSQSVVFFAPPEVHQSILDTTSKYKTGRPIDSYDVVCWLLEQTCSGIEQLQPLYFSQGADFCRRAQAALDNRDFLIDTDERKSYIGSLRQSEQQTLQQLYGVDTKMKSSTTAIARKFSPPVEAIMQELRKRRKGFEDTGSAVQGSALQEVEQEREIAYEVEAVREVQKPVHYQPHSFPGLHKDIISFAKTGRLVAGSATYIEAFVFLGKRTTLGRKYDVDGNATSCKLFVSDQFTRTIKSPLDRPHDQFQRPANWILLSNVSDIALITIPEEAELLIPLLSESENSPTHLLAYNAPVTRKMRHFNSLQYYALPSLPKDWAVPKWLPIELGIFAGFLYFDYSEYTSLLQYLGLQTNISKVVEEGIDDLSPQDNNIVDTGEKTAKANYTQEHRGIACKPLSFLQEWLAIRRKGQDFAQTPMGFVCQGKPLAETHPFFTRLEKDGERQTRAVRVGSIGVRGTNDEEDDIEHDFYDDACGVEVGADEKDTFNDRQLNDELNNESDASDG